MAYEDLTKEVWREASLISQYLILGTVYQLENSSNFRLDLNANFGRIIMVGQENIEEQDC